MQNARAGIPNRVAQGIRTGGGSWPHAGIVGATSGITPGVTPTSAIKWASVCGRRAGQVERRRRGTSSGTKPERNARRRAADGSPPPLRPAPCKLVTSARFAKRNGRRREAYERRAARAAKQTARWSRRIRSGLDFVPTLHRNFVRGFHFLVSDWQEVVKRRIVLKTI